MKTPNPPTGCEGYDAWTVIAGIWLIYEEQLMQQSRFEEMPTKEIDDGKSE